MTEDDKNIQKLEDRLDALVRTQVDFQKEISSIRGEIVRLRARKTSPEQERTSPSFYVPEDRQTPAQSAPPQARQPQTPSEPYQRPPVSQQAAEETGYVLPKRTPYEPEPILSDSTVFGDAFSRFVSQYSETARANLEEFIGKNLISLIGIVVLILGVGIGAKYAIDNNWISPLTRIMIGYVFGFGLVGLAIKFRRNYRNFSAVLISGGMAIMYFVTFFAYSSYALLSQLPAFGLMVLFTGVTVAAAHLYSRQVIAHIGLVGAYAVPFLLSNDSGNYLALFIYIAVVNTGILAISLTKNWKPIFYTSSFFTWAIFCGWFFTKYTQQAHFHLALIFLGVFFAILYGSKIVQTKLLENEDDRMENTVSSTATTIIFFGMCLAIVLSGPLDFALSLQFLVYVAVATIAITLVSLRVSRHRFGFYIAALAGWIIFGSWYAGIYSQLEYFPLGLIFLSVFFLISYATTLVQSRVLNDEADRTLNLAFSVLTTVVFFAFCAAMVLDPVTDNARYWTLFSYLSAASVLILATSFKFFGRVLMYVAVPCTWLIYAAWFVTRYDATQDFSVATIFALVFFALFYFSILYHRLVEDNFSIIEHTSLVLSNGFVFYGFGYAILDQNEGLRDYLGLFTVGHAVLHLIVALIVRALKASAVDVVQVLTVLVLTFASLAVPVQFDGNVVTMVWAVESAVLFWIGRTRGVRLFERYSYPVMVLAIASLGLEWAIVAGDRISGTANAVSPFVNSDFVTAVVFVASFAFIFLTNRSSEHVPAIDKGLVRPFGTAIAAVGCIALFNMFRMEIANYFYLASVNTGTQTRSLSGTYGDLDLFNIAWQINYTLFFLAAMAAVNIKKLRSFALTSVNSVLGVLAIGVFATVSMLIFNELRTIFMSGSFDPDYISHWLYVGIRPISYVLTGTLLYLLYRYSRDPLLEDRVDTSVLRYGFDAIAYGLAFIVASCELINLMGQFRIPDATKLGLSILWGIYALVLVVIGIAKDKKHLRITAIVLLAITLAKLFFYDIADLGTIPKTILFVTLGITLLLISFLYNKYKALIFETGATQED